MTFSTPKETLIALIRDTYRRTANEMNFIRNLVIFLREKLANLVAQFLIFLLYLFLKEKFIESISKE